jgi:predicted GIY-YIG superfamily endonuclease
VVPSKFRYLNPLRDPNRKGERKRLFDDEFFKNIPARPGVYFFLNRERGLLYIGKADDLKKRIMSYRNAKPGSVADHTLEMLELIEEIRWELHSSGKKALIREAELLHALRPPYNIVGTEPDPYLFLGFRVRESRNSSLTRVEFRLSYLPISQPADQDKPTFQVYGCFKHRAKVKAGYLALLRLFHVSCNPEVRMHIPARICQVRPPYEYFVKIPQDWLRPLEEFLGGRNSRLLELVTLRMLENESIPRFMYGPLQDDLQKAQQFFRWGPKITRKVARTAGLRTGLVEPAAMDQVVALQLPFKVAG